MYSNFKVGDIIKFDKEDSIMTWIGEIVKVCEKSVIVKYADFDDFTVTERVQKKWIVGWI